MNQWVFRSGGSDGVLGHLAMLNPIGAPLASVGLHVTGLFHNYNSNLFLPPHH